VWGQRDTYSGIAGIRRAGWAVHEWFARGLLFARLMNMGFRDRDQGTNERAWIAINFFNLCLLDFRRAGGLQRRIERFSNAIF